MFKAIKGLIGFILFLALLIVILVGVVAVIAYDSEEFPLAEAPEGVALDSEVIKDLDNSLEKINSSNYVDNYIMLDLTTEELNSILTKSLQDNINPSYLNPDKFLAKAGPAELNGMFITTENDNLTLKVYMSLFGFFKSSVSLTASAKCESGNFVLSFEEFHLGGKINIKKSLALKLLGNLKSATDGFDPTTMSYSIPIHDTLMNMVGDNKIVKALFDSTYDIIVSDNGIGIKVNTNELINGGALIDTNLDKVDVLAKLASGSIGSEMTIKLTNDEINSLITKTVDKEFFNQVISVSGTDFNMISSGAAIDLKNGCLLSNLNINEAKTSMKLAYNATLGNDEFGKSLVLAPNNLFIGSKEIGELEGINGMTINASTLGLAGKVEILDILIDKNSQSIDFRVKILGL